jgi:hypothetical protein
VEATPSPVVDVATAVTSLLMSPIFDNECIIAENYCVIHYIAERKREQQAGNKRQLFRLEA